MLNIVEDVDNPLSEGYSIKANVDREGKKLKIAISNPSISAGLFNKDKFAFPLDGWTGRYGMPIEFSLALHISTMSSGLVKEMITNKDLQTQVNIGLNVIDCDLDFKFIMDFNGTKKEIKYYAGTGKGGTSKEDVAKRELIYNKLRNGEEVEEEDLSIEGILYAKKRLANKYNFQIPNLQFNSGVHVEAMGAFLSDKYIAVNLKNAGNSFSNDEGFALPGYNSGVPVYAVSEREDSQYGLYSGAYVCTYESDLTPDEETGKLGYIEYALDSVNMEEDGYSLFEKNEDMSDNTGDVYFFVNYRRNADGEYEKNNDQFAGNGNYLVIPKGDLIEDNDQRVMRISALNNESTTAKDLLNMAYKDENNKIYLAYDSMFKEIDWLLACAKQTKGIDNLHYQGYYDTDSLNTILYYTNRFREIVDPDNETFANDEAREEARKALISDMKDDLNEIKKHLDAQPEGYENYKKMKEKFGFNDETLQKVVNEFEASGATDTESVLYTQPYIKNVIRHWFKDVVFYNPSQDSSKNVNVYDSKYDTIEIDFNPDDGKGEIEGIEIKALLTPKDSGKGIYVQKDQPYVVKGETVLKDGKIQDIDLGQKKDENAKESNSDEYCYGDGYRATKKIFTQGFYYTFDGSQETAKSVFWQQQLENAPKGSTFKVTVVNGKVYNVGVVGLGEMADTINNKISDLTWAKKDETEKLEAGKNENSKTQPKINPSLGIIDALEIKPSYVTDENGREVLLRNAGVTYTFIVKEDMSYISPANKGYTYDQVVDRVNYINSIWETMGITSYRQHLSFDNTTTSGEMVATTGLSILKNCDTKDADYIYRDLKEMLIELGYYTEAEFDQLEVKLKWFIPRYNPKQWPQNTMEDAPFAAVLYPADESKKEDKSDKKDDSEEEEVTSLEYKVDGGFREGLEVVAPGACKVIKVESDSITIEFDGAKQPEISIMDGYRMTIQGIKPTVSVDKELEEGDKIGETTKAKIAVLLKNDIGRVLSNVDDYMSPKRKEVEELAYFYFLPYESGGDPGKVSAISADEMAAGLCMWTTMRINGGLNNIPGLCQYLYTADPSLCGSLQAFTSWTIEDFLSDYWGNPDHGQLKKAFEEIAEEDFEGFAMLQLEYALEEKKAILESQGCSWLLEKSPVTVGTYFSLINWGPAMGWEKQINPNMTDEEIIWSLLAYACTKTSTVGSLNTRWTSQYVLAMDILHGQTPEDFKLEEYVFGKQIYSQYGNGNNMNSIENDRKIYGK